VNGRVGSNSSSGFIKAGGWVLGGAWAVSVSGCWAAEQLSNFAPLGSAPEQFESFDQIFGNANSAQVLYGQQIFGLEGWLCQ
jgi:hypothetical protein